MQSEPVCKNVCLGVLQIFQIDLKINTIEISLWLIFLVQVQIESISHRVIGKDGNN